MSKFLGICLLFVICYLSFTPLAVYAADSTSSSGLSDDLKIKLQSLQEEIASRAAKLKEEVSNKLQNRVYIGVVKSKSDSSLIVATKTGSKIVNINQYTEFTSSIKSAKKDAKGISAEDYVAALGDIDDNDVLTAQRIVKMDSPDNEETKIIWGEVTALGSQDFSLQTKDKSILTFSWDKNTDFQKSGSEGGKVDLSVGNPVIVVGQNSKDNLYEAQFIYLFPTPTPTPSPATSSANVVKKSL